MREPYEAPAIWVYKLTMEAGVLLGGSGENLEGWD